MPNNLLKYKQKIAELTDQLEAIHRTADAGQDGILSNKQQVEWDGLISERSQEQAALDREVELMEQRRRAPAARTASADGIQRVTELYDRTDGDPGGGFDTGAGFFTAVRAATGTDGLRGEMDPRLARSLVDTESGPAFMLPRAHTPAAYRRDFRAAAGSDEQGLYDFGYGGAVVGAMPGRPILSVPPEGDPTQGLTTEIPMEQPIAKVLARTDKDHSTSVSGGFTVSRTPETVETPTSRMEMERVVLEVSTLCGAMFQSWELLAAAPGALPVLLEAGMNDQFSHTKFAEKVRGLGGDQYLGVLTALASASLGPTISVSRQTASRILGADVINMTKRLWRTSRATMWIANHDAKGELNRLGLAVYDSAGGTPLDGAAVLYRSSLIPGQPATLDGIPLHYSELASALGTAGDLILADWSQFLEGIHVPLRRAESMHVRFLNREQTFLIWERSAGAPWWRTALTPEYGANTLSPFVILGDAS